MKAFIVTAVAVLVGIWAYSRIKSSGAKLVAYRDPNTGKTVFVDPGTVYTVGQQAAFAGPNIDPVTGAYLPPSAMTGTVGFSAQEN